MSDSKESILSFIMNMCTTQLTVASTLGTIHNDILDKFAYGDDDELYNIINKAVIGNKQSSKIQEIKNKEDLLNKLEKCLKEYDSVVQPEIVKQVQPITDDKINEITKNFNTIVATTNHNTEFQRTLKKDDQLSISLAKEFKTIIYDVFDKFETKYGMEYVHVLANENEIASEMQKKLANYLQGKPTASSTSTKHQIDNEKLYKDFKKVSRIAVTLAENHTISLQSYKNINTNNFYNNAYEFLLKIITEKGNICTNIINESKQGEERENEKTSRNIVKDSSKPSKPPEKTHVSVYGGRKPRNKKI